MLYQYFVSCFISRYKNLNSNSNSLNFFSQYEDRNSDFQHVIDTLHLPIKKLTLCEISTYMQ